MCFSAPASFIAGAGLAVVGAIAMRQAKTRPQRVLACMPLIFSIQQLSEGFLWLSFTDASYAHLQNTAMYAFLAFAHVVWPSYVPYTSFVYEQDAGRKKIIGFLLAVGIITSCYFMYCLLSWPVVASVEDHHIKYDLDFPLYNKWYSGLPYMFAAVIAPLFSGMKRLRYLGLLLLGSYMATKVLYTEYLISVWCFFAAVLSIYVLYIIRKDNQEPEPVISV